MSEWKEYELQELFIVQNGYSFQSKEYIDFEEGALEVLKMGHIERGGGLRKNPKRSFVPREDRLGRWILDKGDIVMAMTDMKDNVVILGVPAIVDKDDHYVLNQRVARLKLYSTKANLLFLYSYFRWPDFLLELQSKANSGVQVNLSTEAIKTSTIALPPLEEQETIAGILSSLDDKIDLLHRQNQTLEALAQTLFRHWFIDNAQDDWEEKPLDEVADYLNGLACQKYPPENDVDRLPVLKIKELRNGLTDQSDWATNNVPREYIVENGDVVFSWSGSLMVKIWDGRNCVLNQHLFKVTSEQFPKWFYYLWTIYHLEKFTAIAESKATTMGHIKRGDLSNSMTLVPTSPELSKLGKTFSPLIEKIILNNRQGAILTTMRDTLLPKLMSGEVRVRLSAPEQT